MIRTASAVVSTVAALALAACATSQNGASGVTPEAPSDLAAQCDATQGRELIGQPASDALLAQARTATGAGVVRALRPDDVVTMEYRADRLNVIVDANDTVTELRCG